MSKGRRFLTNTTDDKLIPKVEGGGGKYKYKIWGNKSKCPEIMWKDFTFVSLLGKSWVCTSKHNKASSVEKLPFTSLTQCSFYPSCYQFLDFLAVKPSPCFISHSSKIASMISFVCFFFRFGFLSFWLSFALFFFK